MLISVLWTALNRLSLSARRAWIEIERELLLRYQDKESLSARRAWIEILCH